MILILVRLVVSLNTQTHKYVLTQKHPKLLSVSFSVPTVAFVCVLFSLSTLKACVISAVVNQNKIPSISLVPSIVTLLHLKKIGKRSLNCVLQYQIRLNRDRGSLICNLKILKRRRSCCLQGRRPEEGTFGSRVAPLTARLIDVVYCV